MTFSPQPGDDRAVAFFAAADDAYVAPSVVALRSFQRWFPECGYYLLGSRVAMSATSLALAARFNIEVIDVDEASRFKRPVEHQPRYPPECFYIFKGPELLARRGYRYSISIDGDVFCARPFDLLLLCEGVEGFRGRPIRTLADMLQRKPWKENENPGFGPRQACDALHIDERTCATRFLVNSGVLVWNNPAMAQLGLFEKAASVFEDCQGYFEGDQDLLAFTAAAHEIHFTEFDDFFNFCFFEDSYRIDPRLMAQIRLGHCDEVRIVHFVFSKPWEPSTQTYRREGTLHQPVAPVCAERTGGRGTAPVRRPVASSRSIPDWPLVESCPDHSIDGRRVTCRAPKRL